MTKKKEIEESTSEQQSTTQAYMNTTTTNPVGNTDIASESYQTDGQDEIKYATSLFDDQLDLVSSTLREIVYLYTQTGAWFSSELQEKIRQAQKLLEH